MSVPAQLGLIAASIALLLAMMAAVRLARPPRSACRPSCSARCVHVAIGLYALTPAADLLRALAGDAC